MKLASASVGAFLVESTAFLPLKMGKNGIMEEGDYALKTPHQAKEIAMSKSLIVTVRGNDRVNPMWVSDDRGLVLSGRQAQAYRFPYEHKTLPDILRRLQSQADEFVTVSFEASELDPTHPSCLPRSNPAF